MNKIKEINSNDWKIIFNYSALAIIMVLLIIMYENMKVINENEEQKNYINEKQKNYVNEEQKNYIIEQARSGKKIIKVSGETEEVLLYENGILEFKKEEKGRSLWEVTKNEPDNIVVKMINNEDEIRNKKKINKVIITVILICLVVIIIGAVIINVLC